MRTKRAEIARFVAKGLRYDFYDTEAVKNTAGEMGFLEYTREVDDKVPPLLKRVFSHTPETFLDRWYAVIYELARRGTQ